MANHWHHLPPLTTTLPRRQRLTPSTGGFMAYIRKSLAICSISSSSSCLLFSVNPFIQESRLRSVIYISTSLIYIWITFCSLYCFYGYSYTDYTVFLFMTEFIYIICIMIHPVFWLSSRCMSLFGFKFNKLMPLYQTSIRSSAVKW